MKGVSAVIAIILILMIVVALAALAYTWFTGIFASLTQTAGTAVTTTTGQMGYSFVVENAKCSLDPLCAGAGYDCISVTIRNTAGTGGPDIDASNVATYVEGIPVQNAGSLSIGPGESTTFEVGGDTTATDEVDCGTNSGTDDIDISIGSDVMAVTIESGLQQSLIIT